MRTFAEVPAERAEEVSGNRCNGSISPAVRCKPRPAPSSTKSWWSAPPPLDSERALLSLLDNRLFVFDGKTRTSLTTPQYHRVSYLASNEPGVLWMVTEDSVEMLWYGSGLTTFGQRVGLPVAWPSIVGLRDRRGHPA